MSVMFDNLEKINGNRYRQDYWKYKGKLLVF